MSNFDSSLYDTVPQTTAAGIVALVRATLVASKGITYPAAHKARRRLREKGEALRIAHAAVQSAQEKADRRGADLALDRAWQMLEARLSCYADLAPSFASDQAEAAELHRVLFPNGMGFTTLPYAQQWAESEAIFHRIAERDLQGEIVRFAGAPFLEQVRARHQAYGEALGITKPKPEVAPPENVMEPLREARAALSTYARVLVVAVENEELDRKTVEVALAPIADLRVQLRSSKKKGGDAQAEELVVDEGPSDEPLPIVD